jgi:hypothetical protein
MSGSMSNSVIKLICRQTLKILHVCCYVNKTLCTDNHNNKTIFRIGTYFCGLNILRFLLK